MTLQHFLHKNHKRLLRINKVILIISFVIILLSTDPGNNITGFATKNIENTASGFYLNYKEIIFIFTTLVFIANLVSIKLLFTFYNPQEFLLGTKKLTLTNKQLVDKFLKHVIKVHSKITNKDYTLYIMNKIIDKKSKKYGCLNYISFKKNHKLKATVDEKINSKDNDELIEMLRLIINQLGSAKGSEDGSFAVLVKYDMDLNLIKELKFRGLDI